MVTYPSALLAPLVSRRSLLPSENATACQDDEEEIPECPECEQCHGDQKRSNLRENIDPHSLGRIGIEQCASVRLCVETVRALWLAIDDRIQSFGDSLVNHGL